MTRKHDWESLAREITQNLAYRVDSLWIQPRERFVEYQQLRLENQSGGELDALLITVTEPLQLLVCTTTQPESLKPAMGRCRSCRPCHAVKATEIQELLMNLHPWVEASFLGHISDPAASLGADRGTPPQHLSMVGFKEAEDDAHGGRLARAVAPDNAEYLAGLNIKVQAVEYDPLAEPLS